MAAKTTVVAFIAAIAGLLGGCAEALPGTARNLGPGNYDETFLIAKDTMAQFYSIQNANFETGVISARPKTMAPEPDSLLSTAPVRQISSMQIRRENDELIAYLSVAIQQEQSTIHRQITETAENYDGVPNKSPADRDGATTDAQNKTWVTQRYDRKMEAQILAVLQKALNSKP